MKQKCTYSLVKKGGNFMKKYFYFFKSESSEHDNVIRYGHTEPNSITLEEDRQWLIAKYNENFAEGREITEEEFNLWDYDEITL